MVFYTYVGIYIKGQIMYPYRNLLYLFTCIVQVCTVCKRTGATLFCNSRGCKNIYHFPCAVEKGIYLCRHLNDHHKVVTTSSSSQYIHPYLVSLLSPVFVHKACLLIQCVVGHSPQKNPTIKCLLLPTNRSWYSIPVCRIEGEHPHLWSRHGLLPQWCNTLPPNQSPSAASTHP